MNDENGIAQVPVVAQLVIQLLQTGQVVVSGPIDDAILPFGMLEQARNQIHLHQRARAKSAESRIVPAVMVPRRVS